MAQFLALLVACLVLVAVMGDFCPLGTSDETCEADQSSLLAVMAVGAVKSDDHGMSSEESLATGHPRTTGSCDEVLFQGLCYQTCTSMGEMEPRYSPSNCGGWENHLYVKACKKDGSSYPCSGMAPGTDGRPFGKCFGDHEDSQHEPKEAPAMCTQLPRKPLQMGVTWKCSEGRAEPTVEKDGLELTCSCPLPGKPTGPISIIKKHFKSVLTISSLEPCDTGCSSAKGFLRVEGIAYCCPSNKKPTVEKQKSFLGDYKIKCGCKGRI